MIRSPGRGTRPPLRRHRRRRSTSWTRRHCRTTTRRLAIGEAWGRGSGVAIIADADNRLWIRQGRAAPVVMPGAPPAPPPIYDIVNRQGVVVDRVQIPPTLTLLGFGPGVVYFSSREGSGRVVAKYRYRVAMP